ncbi:MAG: hypothetical protein XD72_1220 [Methanothrix harundinacea]|uniref:Uncharacterized protein n=1 Tax=Methanothrix harundinacea TaxID=301375 RepID=A0A124FMD4_9EURY|nr:MAG: hypothetical protein XD72_1220 [Methanothrix harundinacea]
MVGSTVGQDHKRIPVARVALRLADMVEQDQMGIQATNTYFANFSYFKHPYNR